MPTMAIAWPISRLPHKSRSDRINLLTLTTPDPPHGERAKSSNTADDRQREEESEDYMHHHQQPVDGGNTETECDLIAPPDWRCSWISHHVERVKDKSDTRHRYQPRANGRVEKQTPQRGLCDKPAEPRSY